MTLSPLVTQLQGEKVRCQCIEQPREGNHIRYIRDLERFQNYRPEWTITRSLNEIFVGMI